MLQLDIGGCLGETITPSKGIPDVEMQALQTSLRRYVGDFLKEREHGGHAWAMDPYNGDITAKVKEVAAFAKSENVRTVVWVGIGGSGLGPKVIQEVFEGPDTMEFVLLDSIDPSIIKMYGELVEWKHAMLVVASKSGGTLEPMSVFAFCYEKLKNARGSKASQFTIAITDANKGPLRSFCLEEGIRMLPVPPDVGGRYSIFTPIGLLPMALLGGDIDQFLKGARAMDTICQNMTAEENPAALLASVQFLLDTKREYRLRIIMPYAQKLESFARWNQQLIAESLGKTETSNPIPMAAIGTQDQHSLLQQWMAGPRKHWHIFIREMEKPDVKVPNMGDSFKLYAGKTFGQLLDACYEGTSQALTTAKRPHVTVSIERLDAYCLGELFFLFLTEVVLLGKLYRIDPYGQPAVEVGKKITEEILSNSL